MVHISALVLRTHADTTQYQMTDNKHHAHLTSYFYSLWIPFFETRYEEEQRRAAQEAAEKKQKEAESYRDFREAYWGRGTGKPSGFRPPFRPEATERGKALKVLGFPPNSSPSAEEIKRAYRRGAMEHHPDRPENHAKREEAEEKFKALGNAFKYLLPDS